MAHLILSWFFMKRRKYVGLGTQKGVNDIIFLCLINLKLVANTFINQKRKKKGNWGEKTIRQGIPLPSRRITSRTNHEAHLSKASGSTPTPLASAAPPISRVAGAAAAAAPDLEPSRSFRPLPPISPEGAWIPNLLGVGGRGRREGRRTTGSASKPLASSGTFRARRGGMAVSFLPPRCELPGSA